MKNFWQRWHENWSNQVSKLYYTAHPISSAGVEILKNVPSVDYWRKTHSAESNRLEQEDIDAIIFLIKWKNGEGWSMGNIQEVRND